MSSKIERSFRFCLELHGRRGGEPTTETRPAVALAFAQAMADSGHGELERSGTYFREWRRLALDGRFRASVWCRADGAREKPIWIRGSGRRDPRSCTDTEPDVEHTQTGNTSHRLRACATTAVLTGIDDFTRIEVWMLRITRRLG